jgi:hypothetical protein
MHHVRADKKIGVTRGQHWKRTVEMTVHGKRGKTIVLCFSTLPTNLGNRAGRIGREEHHVARFPHSHRRGYDEQSMKESRKGAVRAARLTAALQAHCWIGKDWKASQREGEWAALPDASSLETKAIGRPTTLK